MITFTVPYWLLIYFEVYQSEHYLLCTLEASSRNFSNCDFCSSVNSIPVSKSAPKEYNFEDESDSLTPLLLVLSLPDSPKALDSLARAACPMCESYCSHSWKNRFRWSSFVTFLCCLNSAFTYLSPKSFIPDGRNLEWARRIERYNDNDLEAVIFLIEIEMFSKAERLVHSFK